MKHAILNTKLFLMALVAVFALSCSAEDGSDGAPGEQGPAGTDGINVADGNANVQVLTYDISTESGTFHEQNVPEITQDVLDNDVILGYVKSANVFFPLPAVEDPDIIDFNISVAILEGFYIMDFVQNDGTSYNLTAGDLQALKVIIIESSSTMEGRFASPGNSSKENVLLELEHANVDITNYHDVMAYYGLKQK
ncbi:MAG: hypothetical protein WA775_02725 [Psychroserpens sp.]|uniref:hypothetical protein n=1 Tax=Psychroserpens sp. TaxID=2020870 RepID=UPI003CA3D5C0